MQQTAVLESRKQRTRIVYTSVVGYIRRRRSQPDQCELERRKKQKQIKKQKKKPAEA